LAGRRRQSLVEGALTTCHKHPPSSAKRTTLPAWGTHHRTMRRRPWRLPNVRDMSNQEEAATIAHYPHRSSKPNTLRRNSRLARDCYAQATKYRARIMISPIHYAENRRCALTIRRRNVLGGGEQPGKLGRRSTPRPYEFVEVTPPPGRPRPSATARQYEDRTRNGILWGWRRHQRALAEYDTKYDKSRVPVAQESWQCGRQRHGVPSRRHQSCAPASARVCAR